MEIMRQRRRKSGRKGQEKEGLFQEVEGRRNKLTRMYYQEHHQATRPSSTTLGSANSKTPFRGSALLYNLSCPTLLQTVLTIFSVMLLDPAPAVLIVQWIPNPTIALCAPIASSAENSSKLLVPERRHQRQSELGSTGAGRETVDEGARRNILHSRAWGGLRRLLAQEEKMAVAEEEAKKGQDEEGEGTEENQGEQEEKGQRAVGEGVYENEKNSVKRKDGEEKEEEEEETGSNRAMEGQEEAGNVTLPSSSSSSPSSLISGSSPKFVYVYDMGPEFTSDLAAMEMWWWNEQYEAEEAVFELLFEDGVVRTMDPEEAALFYVPVFVSRLVVQAFQKRGFKYEHSLRDGSALWERALAKVRRVGPWFDRNDGRDHFGVISHDHGRCSAFTFLPESISVGKMFFLQTNGDKLVSSGYVDHKNSLFTLLYNENRTPSKKFPNVKCYEEGRDVVIPPFISNPSVGVEGRTGGEGDGERGEEGGRMKESKEKREEEQDEGRGGMDFERNGDLENVGREKRSTIALFRFYPHIYRLMGHSIRQEIHQLFQGKGIKGWDFRIQSERETRWSDGLFCVCPPGHSQWTSRFFKAALYGCIPITFFFQHDNPWQSVLDYSKFSINIPPQEVATLKERIDQVLNTEGMLESFQKHLSQAQVHFRWDKGLKNGVREHIVEVLLEKACRVGSRTDGLPCAN